MGEVLCRYAHDVVERDGQVELARDVGREQQVGRVPERAFRREGLGRADVQRRAGKVARGEGLHERPLVHEVPAAGVGKVGAVPHGVKEGLVGDACRLGRAGQNRADHVGLGEESRQVGEGAHVIEWVVRGGLARADAADRGSHGGKEPRQVGSDVPGAQHQHAGAPEGGDGAQVAPVMRALAVLVGGQALDQREDHGKEVLGDRLAVGTGGAAQGAAVRKHAGGGVLLVAGGVELQQAQAGRAGEHLGGHVAHDGIGRLHLLPRHGPGLDVLKARLGSRGLEPCPLLLTQRQLHQNVHGLLPTPLAATTTPSCTPCEGRGASAVATCGASTTCPGCRRRCIPAGWSERPARRCPSGRRRCPARRSRPLPGAAMPR